MLFRLALCADAVIVNKDTNQSSAINIIQSLTPSTLPLALPKVVFLAVMEKQETDPARHTVDVSLSLNEQLLTTTPFPIDFGMGMFTNLIVTIAGMAIASPGRLHMAVSQNGSELGSWDIVIQAPQPRVEVTPPAAAT